MRTAGWGWALVAAAMVSGCVGYATRPGDPEGVEPELEPQGELGSGDSGVRPMTPDAGRDAGPVVSPVPDAGVDPVAPPPGGFCHPTAGGPYWIVEGDVFEKTVSCATPLNAGPAHFRVEGLPPGASYDAATATIHWIPALNQAASQYLIKLFADAYGETGTLEIGVADKYDDLRNAPVVNRARYPTEFGLPVMFVDFSGTPNNEERIPATVTYRGKTYTAGMKLHGQASLAYPKNTYGLKFDAELFDEPAYGLVGRNKIRLTTTFDDNSYIRHRLAFEMWNRREPNGVPVLAYNAVIYLNGKYHGLYVISDDPDKKLLEIARLNKEGNLYKSSTGQEANFETFTSTGAPKATLHDGFEKKEGLPPDGSPGAYDDLDAFVDFVANTDDASFASGFPARTRLEEFQTWWMLVVCLRANDNVTRNYFLYHDPYSDGPWRYLPWDLSGGFGQYWNTKRQAGHVETYVTRNRLFKRLVETPSLGAKDRMHETLRGVWSVEEILALIDTYAAEIERSALRDEAKWGAAYRAGYYWSERTDFTDFKGEIAYMRRWITDHWALLRDAY